MLANPIDVSPRVLDAALRPWIRASRFLSPALMDRLAPALLGLKRHCFSLLRGDRLPRPRERHLPHLSSLLRSMHTLICAMPGANRLMASNEVLPVQRELVDAMLKTPVFTMQLAALREANALLETAAPAPPPAAAAAPTIGPMPLSGYSSSGYTSAADLARLIDYSPLVPLHEPDDAAGWAGLFEATMSWVASSGVLATALRSHLHLKQYVEQVERLALALLKAGRLDGRTLATLWEQVRRPDTFEETKANLCGLLASLAPHLPPTQLDWLFDRFSDALGGGGPASQQPQQPQPSDALHHSLPQVAQPPPPAAAAAGAASAAASAADTGRVLALISVLARGDAEQRGTMATRLVTLLWSRLVADGEAATAAAGEAPAAAGGDAAGASSAPAASSSAPAPANAVLSTLVEVIFAYASSQPEVVQSLVERCVGVLSSWETASLPQQPHPPAPGAAAAPPPPPPSHAAALACVRLLTPLVAKYAGEHAAVPPPPPTADRPPPAAAAAATQPARLAAAAVAELVAAASAAAAATATAPPDAPCPPPPPPGCDADSLGERLSFISELLRLTQAPLGTRDAGRIWCALIGQAPPRLPPSSAHHPSRDGPPPPPPAGATAAAAAARFFASAAGGASGGGGRLLDRDACSAVLAEVCAIPARHLSEATWGVLAACASSEPRFSSSSASSASSSSAAGADAPQPQQPPWMAQVWAAALEGPPAVSAAAVAWLAALYARLGASTARAATSSDDDGGAAAAAAAGDEAARAGLLRDCSARLVAAASAALAPPADGHDGDFTASAADAPTRAARALSLLSATLRCDSQLSFARSALGHCPLPHGATHGGRRVTLTLLQHGPPGSGRPPVRHPLRCFANQAAWTLRGAAAKALGVVAQDARDDAAAARVRLYASGALFNPPDGLALLSGTSAVPKTCGDLDGTVLQAHITPELSSAAQASAQAQAQAPAPPAPAAAPHPQPDGVGVRASVVDAGVFITAVASATGGVATRVEDLRVRQAAGDESGDELGAATKGGGGGNFAMEGVEFGSGGGGAAAAAGLPPLPSRSRGAPCPPPPCAHEVVAAVPRIYDTLLALSDGSDAVPPRLSAAAWDLLRALPTRPEAAAAAADALGDDGPSVAAFLASCGASPARKAYALQCLDALLCPIVVTAFPAADARRGAFAARGGSAAVLAALRPAALPHSAAELPLRALFISGLRLLSLADEQGAAAGGGGGGGIGGSGGGGGGSSAAACDDALDLLLWLLPRAATGRVSNTAPPLLPPPPPPPPLSPLALSPPSPDETLDHDAAHIAASAMELLRASLAARGGAARLLRAPGCAPLLSALLLDCPSPSLRDAAAKQLLELVAGDAAKGGAKGGAGAGAAGAAAAPSSSAPPASNVREGSPNPSGGVADMSAGSGGSGAAAATAAAAASAAAAAAAASAPAHAPALPPGLFPASPAPPPPPQQPQPMSPPAARRALLGLLLPLRGPAGASPSTCAQFYGMLSNLLLAVASAPPATGQATETQHPAAPLEALLVDELACLAARGVAPCAEPSSGAEALLVGRLDCCAAVVKGLARARGAPPPGASSSAGGNATATSPFSGGGGGGGSGGGAAAEQGGGGTTTLARACAQLMQLLLRRYLFPEYDVAAAIMADTPAQPRDAAHAAAPTAAPTAAAAAAASSSVTPPPSSPAVDVTSAEAAALAPLAGTPSSRAAAFRVVAALAHADGTLLIHLCAFLGELHFTGNRARLLRDTAAAAAPPAWDRLPSADPRAEGGFVGLANGGATCYMNALFQQLFMQPAIRAAVLSAPTGAEADPADSVLCQLQATFAALHASRLDHHCPRSFWNAFKDYDGAPVNVREHQDVLEFFTRLQEQVDAAVKRGQAAARAPAPAAAGPSAAAPPPPQAAPPAPTGALEAVLGGVMVTEIVSRTCAHRSEKEVPFMSFPPMEILNKANLVESLGAYFRGELLEGDNQWSCEACGCKRDAVKRDVVRTLPRTLCIPLKRFDYDYENMVRLKVKGHFAFPQELDMRPFTSGAADASAAPPPPAAAAASAAAPPTAGSSAAASSAAPPDGGVPPAPPQPPPDDGCQYTLMGVVVHSGSAFAGHYYSYIRPRAGVEARADGSVAVVPGPWHVFDDKRVERYDASQLEVDTFGGKAVGSVYDVATNGQKATEYERPNSAYLLFYERLGAPAPPAPPAPPAAAAPSPGAGGAGGDGAGGDGDAAMEDAPPSPRATAASSAAAAAAALVPPVFLPPAVALEVRLSNARHVAERHLLSKDYFAFHRALLDGFAEADALLGTRKRRRAGAPAPPALAAVYGPPPASSGAPPPPPPPRPLALSPAQVAAQRDAAASPEAALVACALEFALHVWSRAAATLRDAASSPPLASSSSSAVTPADPPPGGFAASLCGVLDASPGGCLAALKWLSHPVQSSPLQTASTRPPSEGVRDAWARVQGGALRAWAAHFGGAAPWAGVLDRLADFERENPGALYRFIADGLAGGPAGKDLSLVVGSGLGDDDGDELPSAEDADPWATPAAQPPPQQQPRSLAALSAALPPREAAPMPPHLHALAIVARVADGLPQELPGLAPVGRAPRVDPNVSSLIGVLACFAGIGAPQRAYLVSSGVLKTVAGWAIARTTDARPLHDNSRWDMGRVGAMHSALALVSFVSRGACAGPFTCDEAPKRAPPPTPNPFAIPPCAPPAVGPEGTMVWPASAGGRIATPAEAAAAAAASPLLADAGGLKYTLIGAHGGRLVHALADGVATPPPPTTWPPPAPPAQPLALVPHTPAAPPSTPATPPTGAAAVLAAGSPASAGGGAPLPAPSFPGTQTGSIQHHPQPLFPPPGWWAEPAKDCVLFLCWEAPGVSRALLANAPHALSLAHDDDMRTANLNGLAGAGGHSTAPFASARAPGWPLALSTPPHFGAGPSLAALQSLYGAVMSIPDAYGAHRAASLVGRAATSAPSPAATAHAGHYTAAHYTLLAAPPPASCVGLVDFVGNYSVPLPVRAHTLQWLLHLGETQPTVRAALRDTRRWDAAVDGLSDALSRAHAPLPPRPLDLEPFFTACDRARELVRA